jgi:putative ABC transport system permease protein
VVFQFAVAVVLLVGVGTMWQQVRYMQGQDLRFDGEDVVVLDVSARDYPDPEEAVGRIEAFEQQVAGLSGVESVSLSSSRPGQYRGSYTLVSPEDQRDGPPLDWRYAVVDAAYFDTYGIEFAEGRGFDAERSTDEEVVVINEAAQRALGWDTAVGRTLYNSRGEPRPIVGVTKDFHYQGLQTQVEPVLHFYGGPVSGGYRFLSARIDRRNAAAVLGGLEAQWGAFDPTRAFTYAFADEAFATLYETEQNLTQMVATAALIAVLVACLGLLGLAAFSAQQRTKEIGVRKVLGASVRSVVGLLARDFALLVAVGFVVGAPIAYLALDRWLDGFAYRTTLSPTVFILAGAATLAFAVLTVGTQALRAARVDPVESLRA